MKVNSHIIAKACLLFPAIIMFILLFTTVGCKKDKENDDNASVPVLTTTAVSSISKNNAQSGGNITSDGGAGISVRGICWSTSPGPEVSGHRTSDGAATGSFVSVMTGLSPSTVYYVRAYATNSAGTAYGNEVSFKTLCDCPATVTDYDGNVYNTVMIGSQCWMKENLKVTHYSNGASVSYVYDDNTWLMTENGAYCNYNNSSANAVIYGRLYNVYALVDIRGLCPVGWHVPTDAEWITLIDYLGGSSVAGGALKEAGTVHWQGPNTGTNSSGFTALPAGWRWYDGNYTALGIDTWFWSYPNISNMCAYSNRLVNSSDAVTRSNCCVPDGFSVRCIHD